MKRLTRSEALEIIHEYLKKRITRLRWFNLIKKEIKAIIFYGSASKETNRADSDIDILIVLPLKIEERYTKGEYFYRFKGREINIVLRSIEGLRKIARERKNPFQARVFRKSEIVFQKDDEVKKLREKILHKNKK